jgi:UDP-3-O-[3-hydroxymyristoyl] N-acetylglucosamine deacetylase
MNETILVVDDDSGVSGTIGGVLRDEGYDVVTADDGQEALRCVEAHNPDLVLLDVWMPGLDGIQVLSRIKHSHRALPVIVLSGHGNVEMAVKATRMGAVDFIEKPFSIDGLLSSVVRALDPTGISEQSVATVATTDARHVTSASAPHVTERTIAKSVVGSGLGLHSGVRTGLILLPLPPGNGVRFGRVGSEDYIDAVVSNVDSTGYATSLHKDGFSVRTVEHLLSALHAYGITNLLVKVEGEVPILDGSAAEFCALIDSVGVVDQDAAMDVAVPDHEFGIELDDDRFIRVSPCDRLEITYELSYPQPVGKRSHRRVPSGLSKRSVRWKLPVWARAGSLAISSSLVSRES